jgi:signal transduction histidine kinase
LTEIETNPNIYIKTNCDRLAQILMNLIDNAVQSSEPQAPIIIKLTQAETQTMIQVNDSGWHSSGVTGGHR